MKKLLLLLLAPILICLHSYAQSTAKEWYDKGKDLKDDKKYKEALDAFKKSIALKADYAPALHQAGWCYNELEMYDDALVVLKKEEKAGAENKSTNYQEIGYALKGLKRYDEAISYFDKAIAADPDYTLPYKERGNSWYKKEEYQKALNDYNKYASLRDDIEDVDFYYDKAWCENELEKYNDAVESLKKCIELDNTYADAYSELGFSCYKLHRDEEALSYYRAANYYDENKQMGIIGQGDVFYNNIKNYDSAMYYFEKATSFNKTNKSLYYKLGWCYNDKERYSDAVEVLTQVVKLDPKHYSAMEELGFSYYKLKKYNDALVHLKKAMTGDAQSELSRYYAGLCYNAQGNKAEAQKMYDQLKTLKSDYADELAKVMK